MTEILPGRSVLPEWVETAFAMRDNEIRSLTDEAVTFEITPEAIRLDATLRPVQILKIDMASHKDAKQALSMLLDLQKGAERYGRPIEISLRIHGMTRDDDPSGYAETLRRYIIGYDRLGFYVTEGVSYEGLETVSLAYLPDGIMLPLSPSHIALGRCVVGLNDGHRAHRNAFCAGIATTEYGYLMEMKATGHAIKADTIAGRAYFGLTPKGFTAVLRPGESTVWRTLPTGIVLRQDDHA